jgi:hypothetical protein
VVSRQSVRRSKNPGSEIVSSGGADGNQIPEFKPIHYPVPRKSAENPPLRFCVAEQASALTRLLTLRFHVGMGSIHCSAAAADWTLNSQPSTVVAFPVVPREGDAVWRV